MGDRITLSRAKGWRKPEGTIIVARPSLWGNPWAVGTPGKLSARDTSGAAVTYNLPVDVTQAEAEAIYRGWLRGDHLAHHHLPECLTPFGRVAIKDHLHARRQLIHANLHTLRGHDLACWCKAGTPCHADVLLEIANQ
jgi:hypothetical protein